MTSNLVEQFAARQQEIIDLLRHLVELESFTSDKPAVDRLSHFIADQLREAGASVSVIPQTEVGDQVTATWGENGKTPIVTLCHIDTVWPVGTLSTMPLRAQEGRLYGPGVYDMKAGTALLITVLRYLRETGTKPGHPLRMLFTTDEEVGSMASRALIETEARKAALVLCLEPALANGALKTFRKGTGDFTVIAHGRAAHAGADHAKGINAIEELAHQIIALQAMTNYEAGTTINAGVISGGSATNVVPEQARIEGDLRVSTRAEGERILKAIQGLQPHLKGARLEISATLNRPPMERTPIIVETFQKAQAIAARIGLELKEGSTGGASDANFTGILGAPTLDGLGAVGDGGHASHEHIIVSSLAERAALLTALVTEW